ncbi:MAG: ferrichrome ABC transporter permease [Dehalococcoidia bacterium]|nr:MAG: ferrichrome ABC transporter permease [Dehalococcoidia bacterium]
MAVSRFSGGRVAAPYAATIFLSAFLVFQVQPIIAKFILPWFGGGSAVWTATQLFFQVGLLGGYAYAHLLASRLGPRRQGAVHLVLLMAALVVLPIIPNRTWQPEAGADPTLRIVALLAATVGAPYVLLSTTGPLVQQWFARAHPGRNPYVLYALSNAGSLLGLLAYPVLVERVLGLRGQAWVWSAGYAAFAALCGYLAWRSRDTRPAAHVEDASLADDEAQPVGVANVVLWATLPACAVVLLLAVTTQITQDVAAIPLLWVLPLSIYLVTFILCFSGDRWYEPQLYGVGLIVALATGWWVLNHVVIEIMVQIAIYCFLLFFGCMALHGELTRVRPPARHLTAYYLLISAGGALGGVFVALVAPRVFDGYWEYHLALAATAALVVVARLLDEWRRRRAGRRSSLTIVPPVPGLRAAVGVAAIAGVLVLSVTLWRQVEVRYRAIEFMGRNFYGSVRIYKSNPGDAQELLVMEHGRTLHGYQYTAPERRADKTGYYGPFSGAGISLTERRATLDRPMRIGVVGLGAGMLAAYAQAGDTVDIYEINPMVLDLAESRFTFLADARTRGATVEVHLGDARLVLERQLEAGPKQFDVLLLDAFSSDSIPVHLLTEQAFAIYHGHLAPEGVIATNISNRHVDLRPVLLGAGESQGLEFAWVQGFPDTFHGYLQSDWTVLGPRAFIERPRVVAATGQWEGRRSILWTDDSNNLFSLLRIQ